MKVKELKKLVIGYIALAVMFVGISIIVRLYLDSFLDVWHMSSLGKYLLLNASLSIAGALSAMINFKKDKIGLVVTFGITAVLVTLDIHRIWYDINTDLGVTLVFPVLFAHLYLLVITGRLIIPSPRGTF